MYVHMSTQAPILCDDQQDSQVENSIAGYIQDGWSGQPRTKSIRLGVKPLQRVNGVVFMWASLIFAVEM